jgi:uncharacterized protein YecT (DUF1311 family)
MKTSPLYFFLAIVVSSPQGVQAQGAYFSKQFTECMNKSGGITSAMVECISAETQRQDQYLNKSYKALMATLSSARKEQLQEAQRAWIKFRDSNCSFYLDPNGGSMSRVSAGECVMTMTASRANELVNLTR